MTCTLAGTPAGPGPAGSRPCRDRSRGCHRRPPPHCPRRSRMKRGAGLRPRPEGPALNCGERVSCQTPPLRGDVSERAKAVRRGETPFDADTGLLGGDVEEVIVNRIQAQDYLARYPLQRRGHRPKPLHTRPVEDDSVTYAGEAIGTFRRDEAPG